MYTYKKYVFILLDAYRQTLHKLLSLEFDNTIFSTYILRINFLIDANVD